MILRILKHPLALIGALIVVGVFALFIRALLVEQLPIWTAPRPEWMGRIENGVSIAGDAPAACEAADLLARSHAARDANLSSGQTQHLIAARFALQEYGVLPADSPVGYGTFLLHWENRLAQTALVTHHLTSQDVNDGDPTTRTSMAGMVLINADTNAVLSTWIIPGGSAVSPANACPFDVRGALIDLIRSRPFIGLMSLIMVVVLSVGAALIARRLKARRKNKHGTTAEMG